MPSAPYYRHNDPTGSALNNVATEPAQYDELINKPRVFTYKPSYGTSAYGQQGISHPAPVYYANQPQPQAPMAYYLNPAVSFRALPTFLSSCSLFLTQPTYSTYYYLPYPLLCSSSPDQSYYSLHRAAYAAPPDTPMGYYYSQPPLCSQTNQYTPCTSTPHAPAGYYYPSQVASGTHYPGYPYPQQASGSTTLPDGTSLFLGKTKEQVMWENQQIANNTGANDPVQMVPYKAAPGQQFWCRELDGSWTLRTVQETMVELQPGYWDKGQSGHAVFIRQKP